jgi:hypothetical protein
MKFCLPLALVLVLVGLVSCAPGAPQLMPMETLFPLELGTLEDQVDLFQRADQTSPERNRFFFYNGLVLVSDGNARKVMEFSSYGDLLTLFYNPDSNPVPAMVGPAVGGAPGQVQNRRAFAYPFDELGEIALTEQNRLYVEDRVPTERRAFDPSLVAVLESRVLRFDRDGKFLDFLGQEGIGGTPFPLIERLTVTASGDLVVTARTGKGWAVWWFDKAGTPVDKTLLSLDPSELPKTDGADSSYVPQLEAVFADWKEKRLHVKIDYYKHTIDATTKTDSGVQQAQSRIWTYEMSSKTYRKSYALPVLKRQKSKGDTTDPVGDRPFEFLGVSEAGLGFFLSSPENGSLRFLVCRPDGSTIVERNIQLAGADSLFAQYAVTRSGILVGFLSDGNKAQVAWWRSDQLLGTYAQTGF